IYDFNENLCQRWEHEINQIAYPWQYDTMPHVKVLKQDELFQCDVFVFCASKAIPPVGSDVKDVRMVQLAANGAIISQYGKMAREAGFQGLFAVVSDPVDPLCQRAWKASNEDENGVFDGKGLRPEQVQGYGLGVMNSRAAYYAKQDSRFTQFLTEGRAYGPHGQQLVIADSIANYNHELSMELTKKTVEANLEVRALGYKPYIAPAISSAAISILLTIRGEWHYSSNYLGGIFMGAKNRSTVYGVELEHLPLPEQVLNRLQAVVDELSRHCV
ncbi:MAG: lactate dehydrogenase, partial [Peptococcaceae bacterium]|nr:lactate dehydrogenase [Peptococcaceae bacterium]